jgi:hypothetical protein
MNSRPPLVRRGFRLFHEVSIKSPDREDLVVGTLSFPTDQTFHLEAQTPFGMTLFEVGWDGENYRAKVSEPLEGKFPAEGLARDIHRIYFASCPDNAPSCTLPGGLAVTERLDVEHGTLAERRLVEPAGRVTAISYEGWKDHEGVPHPELIVMRSGGFEVRIALVRMERSG